MASKRKKSEDRVAEADKPAKPKAEKSKGLLPKTINGVKLPKDVREKLGDLAKHPVVADLLAAGLVALAARLKNEPKVKETASRAVGKALDAGAGTGQDMAHVAANIATAVVKPVVKRIREAAAAPTSEAPTEAPAASATRTPRPRKASAATAAVPPARRRKATEAGTTSAKPRAAPKPATQEPEDA